MPQETRKRVLLIDGDVLAYQAALAVERELDWGDDWWTVHADAQEARLLLDTKIARLKEKLGADEVRLALSCSTAEGWRRAICPTYKANREGKRKPVCLNAMRKYLVAFYNAVQWPTLEADDVLGIWATQPTKEDRILVSIDKDFKGVPCNFFRTLGDSPDVAVVTEESAVRFHAMQSLMGDRVDGYAGVPGVGEVKAEKMLEGVPIEELWTVIEAAYKKAGLGKNVALTTARVARILQFGDYDLPSGKVKLWEPKRN